MTKSGYEYLLAYKITVPIYDYTVEFCSLCSPYHHSSPPHLPYLPNHPNYPHPPNLPHSFISPLPAPTIK